MTTVELDIWRAANLLLRRTFVAAQRAKECMAVGDVHGVDTWKRIAEALLELLKDKPADGEHLN